jgi:hypothetical protein
MQPGYIRETDPWYIHDKQDLMLRNILRDRIRTGTFKPILIKSGGKKTGRLDLCPCLEKYTTGGHISPHIRYSLNNLVSNPGNIQRAYTLAACPEATAGAPVAGSGAWRACNEVVASLSFLPVIFLALPFYW